MTDQTPSIEEETLDREDLQQAADENPALRRAVALLARTVQDPVGVAAENAQLRNSMRGVHALLHAIMKRTGGDITVPRAEWQAIDPGEHLQVDVDDDQNAHVYIRRDNRAERRARR